ncbi:hypothetical protein [[Mycobacterium] zoologicum]|uniref:hypothetical protein n=1 Tax=[Mycobacterium] zoologicum TaxID=2872311 RepID=UPI00272AFB3F|nr:hypothetical protein [Mycolicibacter sp. MYC101]MEB3064282.1 hypothetical protein [Mycolicibacter sp. MYC101]
MPTRPVTGNPSNARTSRINAGPAEPTTRFTAAEAVTEKVETPAKDPKEPEGSEREIESWLGELRGGRDAATTRLRSADAPPADDATRALSVPTESDATTAIPVQSASEGPATEKLTAASDQAGEATPEDPKRRGTAGGLSAAELLRREGRY